MVVIYNGIESSWELRKQRVVWSHVTVGQCGDSDYALVLEGDLPVYQSASSANHRRASQT